MLKRTYSFLTIMAVLFLVACTKEDDKITHFSTLVDVSASTASADKYQMTTIFSTDNGTTFVDYPIVSVGQKYKVMVVNRTADGDVEVNSSNCFDVDWSGSNPKPNSVDATTGTAEFTMNATGDLLAKVVDHVTAYSEASWGGTLSAVEDYGSAGTAGPYNITLTKDATIANRFNMTNFYGSGYTAYIVFDPSAGTVKFPDQTSGGQPITKSSGTFDQCRGKIEIKLNFDGGDWLYHIEK